jgi:raffinose/stachyose/melibiose transport system substrate-binding protein
VHERLWGGSFDRWNEENPDREFSVEFFANDIYKERIRTALGSGNAPTLVFSWGGGTLAEYADNDSIVDITDGTQDVISRVIPSVADGGMIGDRVYAVPNGQSQPVLIYYNEDLFSQVGVDVPGTWDELIAAVEAFNDEGITPFALAGQSRWPYLMWIQYLTDRIGGPEVFQAVLDGEPDAWSHPAITEALEKIQELVELGAFGDGFGSVAADASADLALVYTERAAMVLQLTSSYSRFVEDAPEFVDESLAYLPFPEIEGGAGDPANVVGNPSNFWSVAAEASEGAQETATEYLNDIVFDEEYTDFLIEGGGIPPVTGLEERLAETDGAEFLTLAYEMVRDAPHFQLSWDQALPPGPAQELLTELDKIFLMQSTPEQFVEAMNATLS